MRRRYPALFARSADDAPVAAHLRALAHVRPAHLGVATALCAPSLWLAAVEQLRALDGAPTPAAGLRCVLRTWDALLGVLPPPDSYWDEPDKRWYTKEPEDEDADEGEDDME